MVNTMSNRILPISLAVVFFLLSFNAYACLVPLYGGTEANQSSDCAMPQEQPARDQCDDFKSLVVQSISALHPLSHVSVLQPSLADLSLPFQHPLDRPGILTKGSPPPSQLPLLLSSILRI
jgi:hypothetical protein